MNLLKEIEVTGELRPTHAQLSVRYDFFNPGSWPLSPRYLFPVPENAEITGLQLLTKSKVLLRAEIRGASDSELTDCGYRLTQPEPGIYCFAWDCLEPHADCTILVSYLFRLQPRCGRLRLSLPFGFRLPQLQSLRANDCTVDVSLSLQNLAPTKLPSGFRTERDTLYFTAAAGEDIVLEFEVLQANACGFIQKSIGRGLGFYRLYTQNQAVYRRHKKSDVQLLLDLSGLIGGEKCGAVKELLFRIYCMLPKEMPVQILAGAEDVVTLTADEDVLWEQLHALSATGGDLGRLLHSSCSRQTPNTLCILVSGGAPFRNETVWEMLKTVCPIHLFTIGDGSEMPLAQQWRRHHLGEHCHFYPSDSLEKELKFGLDRFLYREEMEQVISEGCAAEEVIPLWGTSFAGDGYRDVAISFSGKIPQCFTLCYDGNPVEQCKIETPEVFPQLPLAEQFYGIAKIHQLRQLLNRAGAASIRAIKQQLEELGTKYGILSGETILALPGEQGTTVGIPVQFGVVSANGFEEMRRRPSVFGEGETKWTEKQRMRMITYCREQLLRSIRADGAVCGLGADPKKRAEETLIADLALRAAFPDEPALRPILQDAEEYLRRFGDDALYSALQSCQKSPGAAAAMRARLPKQEILLERLSGACDDCAAAAMLLLSLTA